MFVYLRRFYLRVVFCAVAIAMVFAPPAFAGDWTDGMVGEDIVVTGVLGVDSVSAFRGVKSTKLNPSVYANIEIERGDFFGGVFTNATSIAGEVRPLIVTYANYAPSIGKYDAIVGARYYAFVASSDFDFDLDDDGIIDHTGRKGFFEGFASLSRNIGNVNTRVRVYYAPDVFGETGGSLYVNTRLKMPIGNGFDVRADFGVSEFEREQFNNAYVDYGVGIFKSLFGLDFYLRYSDTAGLAGSNDRLVAIGIEKAWTLAASDAKRDYIRRKIQNRDWRGDKHLFGIGR